MEQRLRNITGKIWQISINNDATNAKSLNEQIQEDVAKRKEKAINSIVVQNILEKFKDTEIVSVELIPE